MYTKPTKPTSQQVFDKLDAMNLSASAQNIIASCDQYSVVELFSTCDTAEQVEEICKALAE